MAGVGRKIGLVAAGFLAGTVGIKLFSSKGAKNAYTHCTAAVLRAKDSVMQGASTLQENCGDILAGAKEINAQRAAKEKAAHVSDAEESGAEETDFREEE